MTTTPATRGRKAKFADPAAAEAWARSKGAPPRGNATTPITEATRGPVRYWLSSHRLPSGFVRGLPMAALTQAWHDTTGAALDALRLQAAAWLDGQPAPTTTTTTTTEEPEPMPYQPAMPMPRPAPQPATTTTPAAPSDDAAALAAILSRMTANKAPLDAEAVRAIVQDEAGAAISAATMHTLESVRTEFAAALAAVDGAPRALRIEIAGRITELPKAPRHPLFDTLLTLAALANEPGALCPMLVGPAGSGKTTACKDAATALGRPFFTTGAATGAHEFTGYMDAAGKYHGTPFRAAFEHGGLFLADEMDRSDPGAVLVLNSALANRFMAFPDRAEPVQAHPDFVMVVAANTYGRGADRIYVGANQLDGATNDRFAMLAWDYDEALERALAGDDAWTAYVQAARKAATDQKARVVISPRASMGGALYRRAGLDFATVSEITLWKGMDAEQRRRIEGAIPQDVTRRATIAPVRKAEAA